MEQNTTGYTASAMIGGSLFGAFDNIKLFLQAPVAYTYHVDWAEAFQISWKAALGALVGLLVKAVWDKFFKPKRQS